MHYFKNKSLTLDLQQHTKSLIISPECLPTTGITETAAQPRYNSDVKKPVFPDGVLRSISAFTFFVLWKDKNKVYRHTYRQEITEHESTFTFDHEFAFNRLMELFRTSKYYYNHIYIRCYCNLLPNDKTNPKDQTNIIWFMNKGKQVFFKQPKYVRLAGGHVIVKEFHDLKTGQITPVAIDTSKQQCKSLKKFYNEYAHHWRNLE